MDSDIIFRAKAKDKQAYRIIFDSYKQRIYKTAYLILKDSQKAEDVVQDTFFQVYVKIGELSKVEAFDNWIYRITVNSCFEVLRKQGKLQTEELGEGLEDSRSCDPEGIALQKELQSMIMKCIQSLPAKQRTVLILFYYNDFSVEEIADIVNCSIGTVKSRLFYGRKLLKDVLIKREADFNIRTKGLDMYGDR